MNDKQEISTGFVIMNPFTGRPMKETPSGMSLENVSFATKEDLVKFAREHWGNPVFMTDGQDLLLPE
jgi:hypothetical protein